MMIFCMEHSQDSAFLHCNVSDIMDDLVFPDADSESGDQHIVTLHSRLHLSGSKHIRFEGLGWLAT